MSDVPVLVTRAEPGAGETCARLEASGLTAIASPMLQIVDDESVALELDGVNHLALTSANGVRAFVSRSDERGLTAWCVGPATRAAAEAAGFAKAFEGAGDAQDLAEMMLGARPALTGGVVHVANAAAAGHLMAALKAGGLDARFAPLYRAEPVAALSEDALACVAGGATAFVLVHSAKGAEAFAAALGDMDVSALVAVAVSKRAGAPLEGLGLRALVHAARPNEDGIFTALEAARLAFGQRSDR